MPIAVFPLGIWIVAIRDNADRVVNTVVPAGAVLVLLDAVLPVPVTLTAVILVAIVVVLVIAAAVNWVVRRAIERFVGAMAGEQAATRKLRRRLRGSKVAAVLPTAALETRQFSLRAAARLRSSMRGGCSPGAGRASCPLRSCATARRRPPSSCSG